MRSMIIISIETINLKKSGAENIGSKVNALGTP